MGIYSLFKKAFNRTTGALNVANGYNQTRGTKAKQNTTITSSTAETTIVTAESGKYLDLYGLVITNSSATGTLVTIKDDTAGTTRFVFYVPPTDVRGFMVPAVDAHEQAATNKNWTATCGSSVASVYITALVVRNS